MKAKRILLLTMSVLAITTLGACRGRGRGRGSTSGADVTSNTGGGPSGIPGGSSQSGGSSQGGSSQGGTTQSGQRTLTTIAADINRIFADKAQEAGSDFLEYNSLYNAYSGAGDYSQSGVDYSNTQAAQSVLKPVVDEMRAKLPSYCTFQSEKYWTSSEDFWDDGSGDTVYEAVFLIDNTFELDVIGYCYEDCLLGQIELYQPTSE